MTSLGIVDKLIMNHGFRTTLTNIEKLTITLSADTAKTHSDMENMTELLTRSKLSACVPGRPLDS